MTDKSVPRPSPPVGHEPPTVLEWLIGGAGRMASAGLIALVLTYRIVVRPLLIGTCKFHPTCSEYALEAIRRHGARRGGALALRRIGRCRPGTMGGIDPVP